MEVGQFVVLSLANPNEKYWGLLLTLDGPGITLRGVNLSSFEDWVQEVAQQQTPTMGASTIFFPLHRVERLSLDEPMGELESLHQSFERRTGQSAETYLDTTTLGIVH